jgi:hypothetical protein
MLKRFLFVMAVIASVWQLEATNSTKAEEVPFPEIPRPEECTREIPTKDQVFDWLVKHSRDLWETPVNEQDQQLLSIPSGAPTDVETVSRLAVTLREWTACRNAAIAFANFAFATEHLLVQEGWPKPASEQELRDQLAELDALQRSTAISVTSGPDFSGAQAIWNLFGARRLPDGRTGVFVVWGQLLTEDGKEELRMVELEFLIFVEENGQYFADELISVGRGCSSVATNYRFPAPEDDLMHCL